MADDKQHGLVKYTASDGSEVKLTPGIVQRYIVTGGQRVDDREVFAFMAKCQARGLNPLAGDAYMTAFANKATGRVVPRKKKRKICKPKQKRNMSAALSSKK